MKKVKILGVAFDGVTTEEALRKINDLFEKRMHESGKMVVTPNPEMLLLAQKNQEFADVLNSAYLSIPDGIGILWASTFHEITKRDRNPIIIVIKGFFTLLALVFFPKYCRKALPERVTGADLMKKIAGQSRKHKTSIFLLGAGDGIAEKTKQKLEQEFPGIHIVGTFAGSPNENDFPIIKERINETAPQLLFVAYGQKKQELWIHGHIKEMASVKIAMGVGGAFDFIAGARKRAPKWMRASGLEWLFRLMQEPKRLRRIVNAVIRFPLKVIVSRAFSSKRASRLSR